MMIMLLGQCDPLLTVRLIRVGEEHGEKIYNQDTGVEKLKKDETIEHYNAIMVEDLKSKMDLVIEAIEGTKISLQNQMSDFRSDVMERFSLIDAVFREHLNDMARVDKNSGRRDALLCVSTK